MSRTPVGLHKEINRTQNGKNRKAVKMARIILLSKPKRVVTSRISPRPPQVAKPVKVAKVPKPSRSTSQSPEPGSKPLNKENVRKRLAINGIPPKSPQSWEVAQAQIEQFKQQMQECRGVGNGGTTPGAIEERAYNEVESLQLLQIYGRKMESRNETKPGSDDGMEMVAASSLEEYYLSGGKMIPPTVQDFIGPVKINRVGDGRGRGLVLSSDVAAGELLLMSNHIAKVSKMETEILEGNFALEAGCWTGSHVLAEQLVRILSTQAWRSSRNRAMLSTLCSRGGEELPVPPISLFRDDTPGNTGRDSDANSRNRTPFDRNEITRLCGIVQCNAFGHTHVTRKNNKDMTRSWSCGLWILPSFMNHSCVPNVATVVIGDAMIVVAARNLKCGDELTVAYFDIFRPLKERRSSMLHSWNFVCTCPRCTLEEKMEDTLRSVAQAYGLRETEAALTVQVLHVEKQINSQQGWDKAWSPYSVIDLAQLAEYIEKVLYQEHLSRDERNWIRASFLSAYLADGTRLMVDVRGLEEPRRRKHARKTHIQTALAAANAVTPGHPQTLQIAAVVLQRTLQAYGNKSFLVDKARKRALGISVRLFGRHREAVLDKIVAAAAADVLSSCVVFLSRP